MSDLVRALLDELAGDPAALERLRELVRVEASGGGSDGTEPALLTVRTTARTLDVSPDTVRRRIAEGALPAARDHGRTMVRADELRGYIDGLERIGQRPGRKPRTRARRRYDFLHG